MGSVDDRYPARAVLWDDGADHRHHAARLRLVRTSDINNRGDIVGTHALRPNWPSCGAAASSPCWACCPGPRAATAAAINDAGVVIGSCTDFRTAVPTRIDGSTGPRAPCRCRRAGERERRGHQRSAAPSSASSPDHGATRTRACGGRRRRPADRDVGRVIGDAPADQPPRRRRRAMPSRPYSAGTCGPTACSCRSSPRTARSRDINDRGVAVGLRSRGGSRVSRRRGAM